MKAYTIPTKVLYIDLTKKKFRVENKEDLFEKYIGGTGVASQLLLKECPKGIDALSPDNPIILAIGPLTGIFPLASKTVAMYKSPHTGNLGESHVGGRSAISIRMAGYGAIVIKGHSDLPLYLSIHDDKVYFKDASTLWGMTSSFTAGRIIREREKGAGLRSIMRIGQAGENMVTYASVTSETYRHFGRLGLGAVFGSKKLKGISISGKSSIDIDNKKDYRNLYKKIYDDAVSSPLMKKYHDLGTAGNILTLNGINALPTKNLSENHLIGVDNISGENLASNFLGKRAACAHCPVGCIHLGTLREESKKETHFYKTTMVGYDFELIYSLGSMLGINDPKKLLKLIDQVEIYGIDAMSVGVVMAWATEMYKKNEISDKETKNLKLDWGNEEAYIEMVKNIVLQENDFYKALAKGVIYAADKYGGKEFALAFGKNEMPGYHTGPAGYLGFLIGARHSHLDNAGYSVDQKKLMKNYIAPDKLVDMLIKEESLRQILSSMVVCFFSRGIFKPEVIIDTLKIVGINLNVDEMMNLGRQIYIDKYKFKFREGFSFDNMHIPKRIFETKEPTGFLTQKYIKEGLEHAKKIITTETNI